MQQSPTSIIAVIYTMLLMVLGTNLYAIAETSYDINTISEEFKDKYILSPIANEGTFLVSSGSGSCISLEKTAFFNDENGDGYAQVGETISYAFNVCNEGTTNLYNITISDQLVAVGGSLPYLAWTGSGMNCNSTTFTTDYIIGPQDILASQVVNTATVNGFGPLGEFVSDLSDDPTNPANIDLNGDGKPDDPTVTILPLMPLAGASSVVWKDQNGNGIQDPGEPGVANVVVNLYDCIGNYIGSQTTDLSGEYTFSDLTPGQYQVQFDLSNLPLVCNFTYQNIGSSSTDSDASLSGLTDCFEVGTNGTFEHIDAGLILLASLSNIVWIDNDGDGAFDFGEPTLPGVRVELYNGNGILVDYQYTDATGTYTFSGLYPGDYYLKFISPSGFDITFPNTGSNDMNDSDVDNSNGEGTTQLTTLLPGENDTSWSAGFYECVLVGEIVWYDTNKNNVFDDGVENGLNGIRVNLYRVENGVSSLYDYVFTGHKPGTPSDDGYWKLCVPPGTYYAEYSIPAIGLVSVLDNVGNDDTVDSDVNGANGFLTTSNFTVFSGGDKCDIGAGFYPQATLGDRIWYDDNQNGIQDNNEAGVPSVQVTIYDELGNIVDQTNTDSDGEYIFYNLRCVSYYVEAVPPTGFVMTQPNTGNDLLDSDFDQSNGPNTTSMYSLQSGVNYVDVDGGIYTNSILSASWVGIEATRVESGNKIDWVISQDINATEYTIERMFGEEDFVTLASLSSRQESSKAEYTFIDTNAFAEGMYYYRVIQLSNNGESTVSAIVAVEVGSSDSDLVIYPNPAKDQVVVELTHSGAQETGRLNVYNSIGELVDTQALTIQIGRNPISLDVSSMTPGIYQVELQYDNQQLLSKLVVIE